MIIPLFHAKIPFRMFTGLIEEIGVISSLVRSSQSSKILVHAKTVLSDLKLGESVSINGSCLTVTEVGRNYFTVVAVQETLKRTNLIKLRIGDRVNLERALSVKGRLSGHVVAGHIDCLAEVKGKIMKSAGFELILSVPRHYLRYLVAKGSVAVEGVSLTVAKLDKDSITISIIPQTAKTSTLGQINIGDKLNIEVDIFSKYIERHLRGMAPSDTEKMLLNSGIFPIGIVEN